MKRFSKLKKAAAAILGAALMLTSLSVPAFACLLYTSDAADEL